MESKPDRRPPKTEASAENDTPDIVGRTGEDMPLAMHDQGHGTVRKAVPDREFDPRLPNRRR
jgi:hypothetical protein